jgi:hypothetical protein
LRLHVEDHRPPNIQDLIFKGVLTLAGASLSVNSFLVKDKVSEMTASLRSLEGAVRNLEVSDAVSRQQASATTQQREQLASRQDRQGETLRALQEAITKLQARTR